MANNISDAWETKLAKLIFQNVAATLLGDAAGLLPSAAAGSLYIGLHTADPTESGSQTGSEATYTGYARVAVARTAAQWPESGGGVSNANAITFGACTAGSNTITHVSIGVASSGATEILASGALNANLAVSAGITPSFAASALTVAIL